jgi:hypothetical protein
VNNPCLQRRIVPARMLDLPAPPKSRSGVEHPGESRRISLK